MKKLIFALLLFSSCYTKNQAIKKFCNQDTIQFSTVIHDTIIVDSIQVDTVFNQDVDSVYLVKDKIEIRYIKKYGKVYLEGKCKADTIYYEKKVMFEVPCTTPKIVWYKQLAADYWWILPSLVIIILLRAWFIQYQNKK
jgi:hypothetical protein